MKGNIKEQGRKANDVVAFLLNNNNKNCSSMAAQLGTENTFTAAFPNENIPGNKKKAENCGRLHYSKQI